MKFKRGITTPLHGWQGAKPKSVGFVQTILEKEDMIVAFCSGEARVLANEVIKLIPLDRGQHVRLRADVKEPRFVSALRVVCTFSRPNILDETFSTVNFSTTCKSFLFFFSSSNSTKTVKLEP